MQKTLVSFVAFCEFPNPERFLTEENQENEVSDQTFTGKIFVSFVAFCEFPNPERFLTEDNQENEGSDQTFMEKTFACFVGKEIRVIRGCKISSQKFYIVSKKRVAFARHSRNDRAPSRNFWGLIPITIMIARETFSL